MFNLSRIYLYLILFFCIFKINSLDEVKPQKIILTYPDYKKSDNLAKQIIDDTISILEKLDNQLSIIYVKESKWILNKKLIEDKSNIDNLAKFFFYTEVSGIVSLTIDDYDNYKLINLNTYNLITKSETNQQYKIDKNNIIEFLNSYIISSTKIISEAFPGIDINKLKQEKLKMLVMSRKNPDTEVLLSGGIGYFSRQSFKGPINSFGFTPYINLGCKTYYVGINIYTEFSMLFNDPDLHPDKKYFLYNFFASFDLGGWMLNQSLMISAGCALSVGMYYINKQDTFSENHEEEYVSETLMFLYPYLSFTFMPLRSLIIRFDLGSFLCITDLEKYRASAYMPIYIKFNLKYFLYKNFFIEFSVPFFMISYKTKNNGENPSFQGMANIGFGYRFERNVK
jgi:hypothetical protein